MNNIVRFDKFSLTLNKKSLSSEPLALAAGDKAYLLGLSDSGVTEFLFLVSGLLNLRGSTSPASKNQLVRTTQIVPVDQLGFVKLLDKPLYSYSNSERSKLIGFIFENPELFAIGRNVTEDFQYSFAAVGKPLPDPRHLKKYGLFDIRDRETEVLSGGEQHRLNCASVLELGHKFIIADFSYSNLDLDFLQQVVALLHESAQNGSALLIHGLPMHSDVNGHIRTFVMSNGRLAEASPDPNLFPTVEASIERLSLQFCNRSAGSRTILDVDRLVGRIGITRPVTFKIFEGEVAQIWGQNGCGKTTLAKTIVRSLKPDAGSFQLAEGVFPVMCFQNPERLFIESSIWKELPDAGELQFIGIDDPEWYAHPRSLSRAKQKLLGTLLALKRSRGLTILDEPTSGLDFPSKLKFIDILNRYDSHTTLIITHDPALRHIGRTIRWEEIAS